MGYPKEKKRPEVEGSVGEVLKGEGSRCNHIPLYKCVKFSKIKKKIKKETSSETDNGNSTDNLKNKDVIG